jgi:hypothetical protein
MPREGSFKKAKKLRSIYYPSNIDTQEFMLEAKDFPSWWLYGGRLKAIEYYSDREDGKTQKLYRHEWKDENYLPPLLIDAYGEIIMAYRNLKVTDRGIEDSNDIPSKLDRKEKKLV